MRRGKIHGGRSERNARGMVRNKAMSRGINLEKKKRYPLAENRGWMLMRHLQVCGV